MAIGDRLSRLHGTTVAALLVIGAAVMILQELDNLTTVFGTWW
jgi:hypothetical protein